MKSSTDKLVLLAHNQDDILIENFSELYSHKIFVYDKSIHLFDKETVIEEHWCQTGMSKSTIKELKIDIILRVLKKILCCR